MSDIEKVIKALEDADVTDGVIKMSNQFRDVLVTMLKEQEAMNIDTFMQWCINSHIMGDATVRGIKYWVGKFKKGR